MSKSTEEIIEENIKKEIESGYFDWRGKNEGIQIYNKDKKENNLNENKSFSEIKSDLAMIDHNYITKKMTSTSYYGKKVLPYVPDIEGFQARTIDEMRAFYAHIQYKEKYDEENSKKSKKKKIKENPITEKTSEKYILYEDIINEKGMKVTKGKYIKYSDSLDIIEKFPKRFEIKESRSMEGHKYLYDRVNQKSAWIESKKKGGKKYNKKSKKIKGKTIKKSQKKNNLNLHLTYKQK
jgi:hypothetical protein